jgi:hypothetical protein
MRRRDGIGKVLDFGLAKLTEQHAVKQAGVRLDIVTFAHRR